VRLLQLMSTQTGNLSQPKTKEEAHMQSTITKNEEMSPEHNGQSPLEEMKGETEDNEEELTGPYKQSIMVEIPDMSDDVNRPRGKLREKKVGEVLALLSKWREISKLENVGFHKGAQLLGIPKKSLDDYMRICKHAKRGNF